MRTCSRISGFVRLAGIAMAAARIALVERPAAKAGLATVARLPAFAALVFLPATSVSAQTRPDTLSLGALQSAALAHDPRDAQFELLSRIDSLRQRTENAELLPQFGLSAKAQYQSDVISLPFSPGSGTAPDQPHDSYDAYLGITQSILDPSRSARREVRRAENIEATSRVHTSLHSLRGAVNEAYFAALSAQLRQREVEAAARALEVQLALASDRVRLGAALPSEAAMLEAELLARRQAADALGSARAAALRVLEQLSGTTLDSSTVLVLPNLAQLVASARPNLQALRERPEYSQFDGSRALLQARESVASARTRPRVLGFGRTGYGRPALNPLATEFDAYWLAGIQVEWSPWNWGTAKRERAQLKVQELILASEEAAFTESLVRAASTELAEIDRLARTVSADERIISLRESVLREKRIRFEEGVVTPADYVSRDSELLVARLTRASHEVELASVQARFLTTAGLEVPR